MCTIFLHESLLNLWAYKASQNSTEFLSEICGQFSCMNPYCICGHLKLVKIRHESFLKFVDNFLHESLKNLWTSKPSQNSTEFVGEICGHFSCMHPYWICGHLKLVKIWHEFLLNFVHNPHESLLNLWASKASQTSTWILTENCRQFFRMNPGWICEHLKPVKR